MYLFTVFWFSLSIMRASGYALQPIVIVLEVIRTSLTTMYMRSKEDPRNAYGKEEKRKGEEGRFALFTWF